MQLTHYNSKFITQQFPVTLVCDAVEDAWNIGSLFRICDAFGVEQLILCGENIRLGRKLKRTSRATEQSVSYEIQPVASEVVLDLKKQGYQISSLEITKESKPLSSFNFSEEKKIALIVGGENYGVSEEILKMSESILHIVMFGQNSSMNVVQATNIALYEITKQLRSTLSFHSRPL